MVLADVVRAMRPRQRRVLPPSEAYALWAENYPPHPHNPLMRAEQSAMAPLVASTRPRRALDVGTGTGRYLPLLVAAGARLAVGVDLSMSMLARQPQPAPLVCADALRLPFADGRFDLVISSLMLGDIEDLDRWIREAARLLRCGGDLIYSDFHPSWATERWRRTFETVDGRSFELPYFPHAIDDHLAALDRGGLEVRTIREPRLGRSDRSAVGRQRRQLPTVLVVHAVKRGVPAFAGRR